MGTAASLDRARRFLKKRAVHSSHHLVCGDPGGISQAVVIPVLAEEERLFATLKSLDRNPPAELARTLIICVVNNRAVPFAQAEQIADNQRTLTHLENLVGGLQAAIGADLAPSHLRLGLVDASSPGLQIGPRFGSERRVESVSTSLSRSSRTTPLGCQGKLS